MSVDQGGALDGATFPWSTEGRTLRTRSASNNQTKLKYQAGGEYDDEVDIDETIYLERSSQPFGGYRWCFICPSNNRRCTVLYQPPGAKRFCSLWRFRLPVAVSVTTIVAHTSIPAWCSAGGYIPRRR